MKLLNLSPLLLLSAQTNPLSSTACQNYNSLLVPHILTCSPLRSTFHITVGVIFIKHKSLWPLIYLKHVSGLSLPLEQNSVFKMWSLRLPQPVWSPVSSWAYLPLSFMKLLTTPSSHPACIKFITDFRHFCVLFPLADFPLVPSSYSLPGWLLILHVSA